jgi:DNA-binding IclR family transcriptional regulator
LRSAWIEQYRGLPPGPVLNEIGLAAIGGIDIRRVARPVLEDLRERTQETISLSLLEGHDIRFIDCVESLGVRPQIPGGRAT